MKKFIHKFATGSQREDHLTECIPSQAAFENVNSQVIVLCQKVIYPKLQESNNFKKSVDFDHGTVAVKEGLVLECREQIEQQIAPNKQVCCKQRHYTSFG